MSSIRESVNKFNSQITKYVRDKPPALIMAFQRKLVLEALSRIILKTPVDTGRARGNWQVTIGSAASAEASTITRDAKGRFQSTAVTDKGGESTIAKGVEALTKLGVYQIVYITNNVPYILRLEHGWSKQAPAGMVMVTIEELLQLFPK